MGRGSFLSALCAFPWDFTKACASGYTLRVPGFDHRSKGVGGRKRQPRFGSLGHRVFGAEGPWGTGNRVRGAEARRQRGCAENRERFSRRHEDTKGRGEGGVFGAEGHKVRGQIERKRGVNRPKEGVKWRKSGGESRFSPGQMGRFPLVGGRWTDWRVQQGAARVTAARGRRSSLAPVRSPAATRFAFVFGAGTGWNRIAAFWTFSLGTPPVNRLASVSSLQTSFALSLLRA